MNDSIQYIDFILKIKYNVIRKGSFLPENNRKYGKEQWLCRNGNIFS